MYGAGHVWAGHAHFYLHDHELSRSPPDESFVDMLKQNCCLSGPHFPPPAIVEALQDYVTNYHKVRRLHLIVVDLWRPWKYNTARAREITDQLWRISDCDDTRRVSPFRPKGPIKVPPICFLAMLWMALNALVTLCGLKETGNLILYWIPLQLTRCCWTNPSFAHLGPPLGLKSCSFRSSFPMICHWMIGMQGSTPCQLCGLTCLCWVLTICAGLPAMTFTSCGRSMMSRACGATSNLNGDS